MAERRPLCRISGVTQELPAGDTLPGGSGLTLLGGAPTILTATSGTWTKNAAAKLIRIQMIGPGGPGGSGPRGDASVARGAGGGGAGGSFLERWFSAEEIAASCAYSCPAGPAGGAARTTDSSAGVQSTAAAPTSITIAPSLTLRALAGNAGVGGSLTATSSGGSQFTTLNAVQFANCAGGSSVAGAAGSAPQTNGATGPGGGGGGGGNSTTASNIGGPGALPEQGSYGMTARSAGNAATGAGTNGGAGADGGAPSFGAGGAGGNSNISGAGGNGGGGGNPGGGGGGGGGSLNGFTGGAGGAGGRGEIRIWEFG